MKRLVVFFAAVAVCAALAVVLYNIWWHATYRVVELSDYHDPPGPAELKLVDDKLEQKNPPFDETLVDSRPLGDWEVNQSAAVIRLDCPVIKSDWETRMLRLFPSYAEVVKWESDRLLPSANLLDGAAKQFDDGLYAAMDLACFRGELGLGPAAPSLVAAIFTQLPQGSPARPFLGAAMELAGQEVHLTPGEETQKSSLLSKFERDKARSKPVSFYNWTPELQRLWRFSQYLQQQFDERDLAIPRAVAAVLKDHQELRQQYATVYGFYSRLTNPPICLPTDALIDTDEDLLQLARKHGTRRASVAIFPPSTSRETELLDRMFPDGVPAETNVMASLIQRIRSGQVDLAPRQNDGWYQRQLHALETMLVPSRAQENEKLLLTARYKARLVEAFRALITKRRETHARQLGTTTAEEALGHEEVRPRLRIEPCATFYLRTARAYVFLQQFLQATVGEERLAKLYGLRKDGRRELNLAEEVDAIRQRFYGFYLVTCEDIGMRPQLSEDEPVDRVAAKNAALAWLEDLENDADLARDTRAAVPIALDPKRDKVRLWATIGVRLVHLEASYARPPKVRPVGKDASWQDVEDYQLGLSRYTIAVDEFAEMEIDRSQVPTRDEFRALCDEHKTRKKIIEALSK